MTKAKPRSREITIKVDIPLLLEQTKTLGMVAAKLQGPTRTSIDGIWEMCHSILDKGEK